MIDLYPFFHGGAASIIAEICTFPIDTTKTRLQIQGELLKNNTMKHFQGGRYNGMIHAFFVIIKQEGISALYRGLSAAVIRQASYGTMKMGLYDKLKRISSQNMRGESISNNIACAVVAGVTSSTIANPTDVIKIRLQSKSNYTQNSSFLKEFTQTISKEGFKGLYKAVIPTAARSALLVGVLLPTYDFTKGKLITEQILLDNVYCHFASSLVAATFGTCVSCPVEVIRTRLMNQSNIDSNSVNYKYKSALDCLKKTIRNERIFALWKGFIPTWYRIGPWNIIFFLTHEKIKKVNLI
uniref:Slc25a-24 n=1 Tax=Schmidtea mediterranea TaxID=79327 RepID=A0A0H3YFF7_SCHMD|nr:slc25a-24 [Schmidtea mediterranea]